MQVSDVLATATVAIAALVALGGFLRWLWPRLIRFFSSVDRMFETINGRPPLIDKAGRQVEPGVPSLSVQLADLKATVSDQAAQNARITAVEYLAAEHGNRLDRLESGHHLERIVGHVETTQAYKTMQSIAENPPPAED